MSSQICLTSATPRKQDSHLAFLFLLVHRLPLLFRDEVVPFELACRTPAFARVEMFQLRHGRQVLDTRQSLYQEIPIRIVLVCQVEDSLEDSRISLKLGRRSRNEVFDVSPPICLAHDPLIINKDLV